MAGQTLEQAFGVKSDLGIDASGPDEAAMSDCDAFVLGLPNGLSGPYVEAIDRHRPESVIVDLSADHRGAAGWVYGLPELGRRRIAGQRRIANPGCYATAAILALHPVAGIMTGTPSAFGISGYSGAGTTKGPRNDPGRLKENILPYGFSGHGHAAEIAEAIGRDVAFVPHVAAFFRGLVVTCTAPVNKAYDTESICALYREAYGTSHVVRIQNEPPEPAAVAGTAAAVIGGIAMNEKTGILTLACALDNLLKGAASQAAENLALAFGLE
jgi:N-acetyl-gamma-glutamyl-phosphate reductase